MHRTRSLALVALTAAATVVVSSCGVWADTSAATVLGRTVTVESVEQLVRDEGFVGSEDSGVEEGSVPGDLFRSVLAFELQRVAWIAEADRWGLEITDEMTAAASQQVEAQITSTGASYDAETREKLEEYVAAQTALETRFSQLDPSNDADLRLLYDGAPSYWDRTCVAVVQIAPDQEGEVDRALAEGTTIEELPEVVEGATLVADPSQCLPSTPGQLPEELEEAFASAEQGSNDGPVDVGDPAAGGATYVFRVDDRRTVGFDEAREELAQIAQGLAQQGAQGWIGLVLAEADIDPRFGTSVSTSNGQPTIDAPPVPLERSVDLGGMLGTTPEAAVPEDDGHAH
jgi:hypothetical protein